MPKYRSKEISASWICTGQRTIAPLTHEQCGKEPASATDQEVLRESVEGTTAGDGRGSLAALVQHLARAARTRCAWVTEWVPEKRCLRALAFWSGDRFVSEYEYAVARTPFGWSSTRPAGPSSPTG